jgi:EAL domain-containing protein (putative c-di-GMP-specific phosphodiesterase class I)
VLRETGLDPGRLTLEITESVLMADVERTIGRLTRLRRLGVRLAIDDFGTGYSSLGYLSRFPVEVLKVDKSFVDDISVSERSRMLAAAVVGLGDTLGMTTLAEGVESEDQRRVLEELGCQNGQGYLFGRPMPAVDFAAILPTPLQAVGAKRAG